MVAWRLVWPGPNRAWRSLSSAAMRRVLVGLVSLALASCRASPALEPLSGFELVDAPDPVRAGVAWSELDPRELERWLAEARERLATIADYRAVLETRERIDDALFPRRVLRVALRHAPFSVVIETDAPASEAGQRVWYDASANEGELLAETPGFLGRLVGRVSLDPEGGLARKNHRHPITDIGLARLIEQVEEQFAPALARARAPHVRVVALTLGARAARLVEAELARDPPEVALGYRLGFDTESGLLVYFGQEELLPDGPALLEEYLYRDLALNVGLTGADFRPRE